MAGTGQEASGQGATSEEETGGKASATGRPASFALGAPYPNPSRERVTLPLALPERATVRVGVYDVLGRRVHALSEKNFSAGRPEVPFQTGRLSSGLYLVRVRIESASGETHLFTEKVTVMR